MSLIKFPPHPLGHYHLKYLKWVQKKKMYVVFLTYRLCDSLNLVMYSYQVLKDKRIWTLPELGLKWETFNGILESYGRWSSFLRAVGRSSFPKYSLRAGDRNTITVLPTILSKISVILFDGIWHISFFFSFTIKELFLNIGGKNKDSFSLSFLPFFFPLHIFILFGTEWKKKIFVRACYALQYT